MIQQARTLKSWGVVLLLAGGLIGSAFSLAEDKSKPPQSAPQAKAAEEIDFQQARELLRKRQRGEKLTPDEEQYLKKARAARRQQNPPQQNPRRPNAGNPLQAKSSLGLVPLSDMTADDRYKNQDGGLYGHGKNVPPAEHLKAALSEAEKIVLRDTDGQPSPDGKIVMISNGMSNTTQEFSRFVELANNDPEKSPKLQIVDCAQGGQEAFDWAKPEQRFRKNAANPWDVMTERLKRAEVSPAQVQVVWLKQARRNPKSLGEFPKHAQEFQGHLVVIVNQLKERFPNLRLVYLSSRIYAGYAATPLNPEPHAYESAFAVRQLIQDQIQGEPALNYTAERGPVKAPLLLWGPYLWADGVKGRNSDDLVWNREDLASDGTHPSNKSGRQKVAELLLTFMKTDVTAKTWFVKSERTAKADGPVKSGLQVGETITAIFEPLNVTGPFAGEPHCLVCENGGNPVVMIFAREANPALTRLLTKIDAITAKHKTQNVGSFAVFLNDREPLADQLKETAKKHALNQTILSIDDPEGPEGFNVAKEAELTVVLYREFQVKANHAFKKGQLSDKAIEKILADVPKILSEK